MDVGTLQQYASAGLTRTEIAEKTGLSYGYVSELLLKNNIKAVRKKRVVTKCKKRGPKPQTLKILDLRRQGFAYKDIANIVGCCKDQAVAMCGKYGLTKDHSVCESNAIETVSKAGFDYVRGFTNTKGTIIIRCRDCGGEFKRYYNAVRNQAHGKRRERLTCPYCLEQKAVAIKEEKQTEKDRKRERETQERAKRKAEQLSRQLERRLAIRVCKNCGIQYSIESSGYNSERYCSKLCQQRWHNRVKSEKRIDILNARPHDNDITLEKLFTRDSGVCYICGRQCDWSDIQDRGGIMVAGDRYPSIDHVKPVSKGGTHTWDNIRLACRECNTRKGWR